MVKHNNNYFVLRYATQCVLRVGPANTQPINVISPNQKSPEYQVYNLHPRPQCTPVLPLLDWDKQSHQDHNRLLMVENNMQVIVWLGFNSLNCFNNSLGHSTVLQVVESGIPSTTCRGHSTPPSVGRVIITGNRDLVPPPHVLLHCSYSPYFHSQSTATKKIDSY